jgi:hypothetical protein
VDSETERRAAIAITVALLASISFLLAGIAVFGIDGMIGMMPNTGRWGGLITSATFLFLITDSQWPEWIRQSSLRSLVRCYAIFQLILACAVSSRFSGGALWWEVANVALGLFSIVLLFRSFRAKTT